MKELWLTRGLFVLACLIAGLLVLLVVLAPWLVSADPAVTVPEQTLELFAHDVVVRRISVVSAIGLVVTASIFFQAGRSRRQRSSPRPRRQSPPTSPMAGA